MNITLLAVTAVLALSPLRASAAEDACAPYAALLKTGWRLSYERVDGPSRLATLDQSECATAMAIHPPRDMEAHDPTEHPEPRLRFWSAGSPYELSIEISGGQALVILMKRDGRYRSQMARLDQFAEGELALTTLDYTGDVFDGEYPLLRANRGVRRTVRAARVVLTPYTR